MGIKVFGWQSFWHDKRIKGHHKQVRCICAAPSKAEIKRVYDLRDSDMFNCCVTGNDREIEEAMAQPMKILASDLSGYNTPFYVMKEPKETE